MHKDRWCQKKKGMGMREFQVLYFPNQSFMLVLSLFNCCLWSESSGTEHRLKNSRFIIYMQSRNNFLFIAVNFF